MHRTVRAGVLALLLSLAACASVNSAKAPDADLTRLKSFYVVRVPEDERGIEKLIAARLVALGYQAIEAIAALNLP